MKYIVGMLLAASALIGLSSCTGSPKVSESAVAAAEKSLEDQLACVKNPEPGKLIREMLAKGLLETKFSIDGIPVLEPTLKIHVYGKKVKFVQGWEREDDGSVKEPFHRAPGTAPRQFIAVILDANPSDVNYTVRQTRNADGRLNRPYSVIEQSDEWFDQNTNVTAIRCYGEY